MILATHGIVGSQILQKDADWVAFYNRVISAGGSLSTTEQDATLQLVLDLKDYGIWTKMKAIYPMVGASAAACAQNLKSSSFTGTFNGGWTFASTGVTPNGTNGFMNTQFVPNTECASANVGAMGIYSRTNRTGSNSRINGINTGSFFGGWIRYSDNKTYGAINDNTGVGIATTKTNLFWQIARNNSVSQLLHALNESVSIITQSATNKSALNVYFGAANNGAANGFDNLEMALCYLSGDDFSSQNMVDMYNAVQAFQTTLNRQV
jgi:hypothetical protein